ncbi:MAG: hypothetical protein ACREAD_01465 [Nitrosopumilaceae archaeon]
MKIILVGIISTIVIVVVIAVYSSMHYEPLGEGVASGGNRTPEQFFQDGGRSYILVTPESNEINATIGSTVQVTLTLKHETSANPLPTATVNYDGARGYFTPNGYNGHIDLNSTMKSSANQISLLAGESKKIVLSISIPKDLPKSFVNGTIPYNVLFALPDDANPKDIVTSVAFFQIHIVG